MVLLASEFFRNNLAKDRHHRVSLFRPIFYWDYELATPVSSVGNSRIIAKQCECLDAAS